MSMPECHLVFHKSTGCVTRLKTAIYAEAIIDLPLHHIQGENMLKMDPVKG